MCDINFTHTIQVYITVLRRITYCYMVCYKSELFELLQVNPYCSFLQVALLALLASGLATVPCLLEWALRQLSVGGLTKIDFRLEYMQKLSARLRNSLMFVLFLDLDLPRPLYKRTQSSSFSELPQPMPTNGCGPFANYRSPQVSLHLHLHLIQHA